MDVYNTLQGLAATYQTMGCKLNFAETSALAESLRQLGMSEAKRGEKADLCVLNTCSVTEVADSKSRQAIRRLHREHPEAAIVVMGCYAQLRPEVVASLEGVELVIGTEQKGKAKELILELMRERRAHGPQEPQTRVDERARIRSFAPSCACGERTRYFLKVQDGCDYFCTYCTIPMARGRSRNGSIESLVSQAREVANKGGREIVLTGVNIGDFGRTTGETFLSLIQALDEVEGIERYRISSLEPDLLTDNVLRFTAKSQRFMPHFHLPLQSGSDEVLKFMHRHYDTALFRGRVERIRDLMPEAFIGVDVIVGMRGETEELFEESRRFMELLPVSQYHVFSYSERRGTRALQIPHSVTPEQKHERSQQVLAISEEKLHSFYDANRGSVRPVLIEHTSGYTDNYIRVEIPSIEKENVVVNVRLGDWNAKGDALIGTETLTKQ